MSGHWRSAEERLTELLADQVTFGLGPDEQRELEELLRTTPDFDTSAMERAAAVVQLALVPAGYGPLPAALRAKIRTDATRYLSPQIQRDRDEAGPG